ncbi:MAG: TrmH family RNA methyltransferase [Christensenellales bacterium]|jgi:TrmH family RNA methyltransferase
MPPLAPYSRQLDYSYAPGLYPAMQALTYQPGLVSRVLVHSRLAGEGADALLAACSRLGIRTETADRALRRLSGKDNCYAAAVFRKAVNDLDAHGNHLVLVNPMDAGNLGTILRAALGLGYSDIALVRPCADPHEPQVVRASMGALFRLRLVEYVSFSDYQRTQGERQIYPFLLSADACPLSVAAKQQKIPHSLVFGNEGSGLPAEFEQLGQPVMIEQSAAIDSYNLAIAAAIGMYAFKTF